MEESVERCHYCTHLVVARPLKRTIKLCIGVSLPHACIVTDDWIHACESANAFVPTAPYALSGVQAAQPGAAGQWQFNATESRKRVAKDDGGCLAGHTFYVTAATKPKPAELKLIIKAAGGTIIEKVPPAGGAAAPRPSSPLLVVSTEEEKKAWASIKAKHKAAAKVIRADKLLSCVLQQQLDLGEHNILA